MPASRWRVCCLVYGGILLINATEHRAGLQNTQLVRAFAASSLRRGRTRATVRMCAPPGNEGRGNLQPEALLSEDVCRDDDMGGLAAGLPPILDSRPPPPPPPATRAPRRSYPWEQYPKPSRLQVSAAAKTPNMKGTEAPGNAAFCGSRGKKILPGGSVVRHWTDTQVEQYQYTNAQLGPSACAPAGVLTCINMLSALPRDPASRMALTQGLVRLVRQRSCNCRHDTIASDSTCDVPLQMYLLSRSNCGGGGIVPIIDVVEAHCPDVVGAALIIGEHSPFEKGQLLDWVAQWMQDGAALTLTTNRQKFWDYEKKQRRLITGSMPDACHAQPIVGVDIEKREVIMANPVKSIAEEDVEATVASPPTLRIRGNEVLLHCEGVETTKISQFNWPTDAWRDADVSQQVLLLRKHFPGELWVQANKAFVTIPYAGTGKHVGPLLRLFAPRSSEAGKRILTSRDPTSYLISV